MLPIHSQSIMKLCRSISEGMTRTLKVANKCTSLKASHLRKNLSMRVILLFLFFEEKLNSNQNSFLQPFLLFRKTRLSNYFFCFSSRKLDSATVFYGKKFRMRRLTLQNKQKLLGSATAFSCDKIKN